VDIHLLLNNDSSIGKYFGSIEQTLEIQSRVEERYFSKDPHPLHVPRPQLTLLNKLLHDDNYVHPPTSVVSVLYGEDAPEPDYGNPDRIRASDCSMLVGNGEFLQVLPLQAVDRPAGYIRETLKAISWRVSPAGPRVLHITGLPTEVAWSVNRTSAALLLKEKGQEQLAQDYADYYLHAWEYYLSEYTDSSAGRLSLLAGVNVLTKGMGIAHEWLGKKRVEE